jgi:hypothetical protein
VYSRGKSEPKKEVVASSNLHLSHVADIADLEEGIDKLKEELLNLRSEKLGPVYPGLYKFLGFKKPTAEPKLPDKPKYPDLFVPQPPPYQFPPTIIDVRVLAGEVDSGRYPSMNRNATGRGRRQEHEDACYICKESKGRLFLCDFCPSANHLECIRSRFVIKDPEPHDDFMCNKCIQKILQRRRRAEQRRLNRYESEKGHEQERAPSRDAPVLSEPSDEVEKGKELEYLGKQAHSVDDIMELLRDSNSRLRQLVETSKISSFRRSFFIDGAKKKIDCINFRGVNHSIPTFS